MSIKRGTTNHTRRARNYTHGSAQKRLNETVPVFNEQVLNALNVDTTEVHYYHIRDKGGVPCTCTASETGLGINVNIDSEFENSRDLHDSIEHNVAEGPTIRLNNDGLFGDSDAERSTHTNTSVEVIEMGYEYDPSVPDVMDAELDVDGNVVYEERLFSRSIECPLCYNSGFVPGLVRYGYQSNTLCSIHVDHIEGYHVESGASPHRFNKVDGSGYVSFKITVPLFFKQIEYSVRSGEDVIRGEFLYIKGHRLTTELVRRYAGHEIDIEVRASSFTHLRIDFDLGLPNIKANISDESQSIDFSIRDTVGNFTLVLPPTIHEIRLSDIIVVPHRRLVLRVMDKQRKITADIKQLEWVVSCRVVQPKEPVKNVNRSFVLE